MKLKRHLRVVHDAETRSYERLICDWDTYLEFFPVLLPVTAKSMAVFEKCFRQQHIWVPIVQYLMLLS